MDAFKNRHEAGLLLAKKLTKLSDKHPLVLALPRGGIPVAVPIAETLGAPFNILAVRKIPSPRNPEWAVGAVSEDGIPVLNEELILRSGLDIQEIKRSAAVKTHENQRQMAAFRAHLPAPTLEGRTVILVDDGIATGSTVLAAIQVLRKHRVAQIHLAVPVVSKSAYLKLKDLVEELVTLVLPHDFSAVSDSYEDFEQVTDDEALRLFKSVLPQEPIDHEIDRLAKKFDHDDSLHALAERMSQSKIVMLGEATHGTKEFYEIRRKLSQILIQEHGFDFIAVEGDWPDCQEVNRYIRTGRGQPRSVLQSFKRWPTWMWANEEILPLMELMRRTRTEFFGLDVYSLFESIDAINESAQKLDPETAARIQERYACFDPFARDEMAYSKSLFQNPEGCEEEVVANLTELLDNRLIKIGLSAPDLFDMKQNARVIKGAEAYYRAMIGGGPESWNLRDQHMIETLEILLKRKGPQAKAIVWAHNTHIGDYRATNMAAGGYVNLGGLARETFGPDKVSLVGFGTHRGEVMAGRRWGAPAEVMPLPPAGAQTYELKLHEACERLGSSRLALVFDDKSKKGPLSEERMHRAVGVVYSPTYEASRGNDVPTVLTERYDMFLFIDETHALKPLPTQRIAEHRVPETWPSGV